MENIFKEKNTYHQEWPLYSTRSPKMFVAKIPLPACGRNDFITNKKPTFLKHNWKAYNKKGFPNEI